MLSKYPATNPNAKPKLIVKTIIGSIAPVLQEKYSFLPKNRNIMTYVRVARIDTRRRALVKSRINTEVSSAKRVNAGVTCLIKGR